MPQCMWKVREQLEEGGFIISLTLGGGGSGLVCVYWAPGVSTCDLRIQGSQDAHVCWGWVPEERFCMASVFKS